MSYLIGSGAFLVYVAIACVMLVLARDLPLLVRGAVGRLGPGLPDRWLEVVTALRSALSAGVVRWGYCVVVVTLHALIVAVVTSRISVEEVMAVDGAGSRQVSVQTCCGASLSWTESAPIKSEIDHRSGHSFTYPMTAPRLFAPVADSGVEAVSPTTVREDGVPLRFPHALHAEVDSLGGGRYSHWGASGGRKSWLIFSSTDNSSPLENGKQYTVRYQLSLSHWALMAVFVISIPAYLWVLRRATVALRHAEASGFGLRRALAAIAGLAVVALFVYPLHVAWSSGNTGYLSIGGYLPWSDASGWLHGIHHLLNEQELFWWTVRRPMNPVIMSTFATVGGSDLQVMLSMRGLLLGTAALLLAQIQHGIDNFKAFQVVLARLQDAVETAVQLRHCHFSRTHCNGTRPTHAQQIRLAPFQVQLGRANRNGIAADLPARLQAAQKVTG